MLAEPDAKQPLSHAESSSLRAEIRKRVVARIGIAPADVVLLERGPIPVTTSGKLQRAEAARRFTAQYAPR